MSSPANQQTVRNASRQCSILPYYCVQERACMSTRGIIAISRFGFCCECHVRYAEARQRGTRRPCHQLLKCGSYYRLPLMIPSCCAYSMRAGWYFISAPLKYQRR
jgi:hypothetical protein